jgi:signal transduction histidine kinase
MASQQNVKIQIDIQPDVNTVKIDPTHLRQIVINLASNAIKYNHPGGKVSIRFSRPHDARLMIIEVQDTGIGIPREKIPNLFAEYYRMALSAPSLIEGTGLGLTFVKRLVELYGGNIDVESEVGVGSLFRVMLPLTVGNEIIPRGLTSS